MFERVIAGLKEFSFLFSLSLFPLYALRCLPCHCLRCVLDFGLFLCYSLIIPKSSVNTVRFMVRVVGDRALSVEAPRRVRCRLTRGLMVCEEAAVCVRAWAAETCVA